MKTHNAQFVHLCRRAEAAFTLIELLVTISIIALVLGIAGPTTMRLFSSSSNAQAYNMFSTQMALARAGAIESANFVGLHCQITDSTYSGSTANHPYVINNKLADKCVTAIVAWDEANNTFDLKAGEQPQEVPGGMAFGNVNNTYVEASTSSSNYNNYKLTTSNPDYFTTFTILFNKDGELVKVTDSEATNKNIIFNTNSGLFTGYTSIWNRTLTGNNTGQQGASCVTLFNYLTLNSKKTDASAMNTYLNETGQFIAANIYTGRLFTRE